MDNSPNPYAQDKKSKEEIKSAIKQYIESSWTVTFFYFNQESALTPTITEENEQYPIDFITVLNKKYGYLTEAKDRRYRYNYASTDKGTDRNGEGWVLEIHKFNDMKTHKEVSGFTGMLYVCEFTDCILVWNLDKCKARLAKQYMCKKTVEESKKVWKDVYWLYNDDAIRIEYADK